jgi:hypothetical protein
MTPSNEKWRIAQFVLGTWPRTIRFCLIICIIGITRDATTWMNLL